MKYKIPITAVAVVMASATCSPAVNADAINPQIRDSGKVYSKELPNSSYYGTGIGGRAAEASVMRFEAERELQEGNLDEAITKAKRACQLDPADPDTHMLLARALTRKFYSKKGEPDEKLLRECLYEWQLLWHHDSDQWQQQEAKGEARRLIRIAKAIATQRRDEQVARARAREEVAKSRNREQRRMAFKLDEEATDIKQGKSAQLAAGQSRESGKLPSKLDVEVISGDANETDSNQKNAQIASKKKRRGLF